MADEKLNTGPAENISPEAAEPIATPEQAVAFEPQQEQTGPAIPEPGDVVVSFDKINELMAEKRQNARAEVEKAEKPIANRQHHRDHKEVGRDGEGSARLFHTAQVDEHDKKYCDHSDPNTIREQVWIG